MDNNLEFWKGSCGYSAPGSTGFQGRDGNSIHFSSIDTSTNFTTIIERILHKKSLTNNTEAITEEKYKVNDYILDTYGNLSVITSITPSTVTKESIGNIAFPPKTQGYTVPVNSSTLSNGKTELQFTINNNSPSLPPYANLNENAYMQREHKGHDYTEPKLWRYRYTGNNTYIDPSTAQGYIIIPRGYYIVPKNNDSYLYGYDDDGNLVTYENSKDFVQHIIDTEEYCKIYAILNNGLVIESTPKTSSDGIFIEKGYIESIDKNLTTLLEYGSFRNELLTDQDTSQQNKIKDTLKSNSSKKMCNMYFEYSHNGEIYRMHINVT